MFKSLLFIFLGGGLGSITRYGLYYYIHKNHVFPFATLLANVIASFMVGFLAEKINSQMLPEVYKYLLITGFCGGLSTFSTFSYENVYLLTHKQFFITALYTLISTGMCFLFTFLGIMASRKI